ARGRAPPDAIKARTGSEDVDLEPRPSGPLPACTGLARPGLQPADGADRRRQQHAMRRSFTSAGRRPRDLRAELATPGRPRGAGLVPGGDSSREHRRPGAPARSAATLGEPSIRAALPRRRAYPGGTRERVAADAIAVSRSLV